MRGTALRTLLWLGAVPPRRSLSRSPGEARPRGELFFDVRVTTAVRLVVACHSYFPAVGGLEGLVQGLAEGVARRGLDVQLVTRQDPGTSPVEQVNGVSVHRIAMRKLGRFYFPRGYRRMLRSLSPDVVHLHGNRVWSADYYLPFAGRFGWPQVMTGHGFYQYELHHRMWDRWYFERYLPSRLRFFAFYGATTEHERNELLSWGVEPSKVEVIPAAISLAEFERPQTDLTEVRSRWGFRAPHVLVYAGGFYPNKRVDRLIRSVAATRGRWALVAVGRDMPGSGYDRAAMSQLAAQLGVEAALHDVVPRSQVLDALSAADAVGLGSSYEGFGILLLEAMAAGRPFVAFRTGAAPELAATGAGICVDTEAEFAAALTRLEDTGLRNTMGQRGREAAPRYSIDEQAARYLRLYERAVEAPPRPP